MDIIVRYAQEADLPAVNQLRRMVNDVHVEGRPDIFRPGFGEALQKHLYDKFFGDNSDVMVAESDGEIVGFAVVEIIEKPDSPYNLARSFYHVEEFGVSPEHRRMGVASAMVDFMKQEAAEMGLTKIELDMWEFNQSALSFYESAGFKTYRRYMELDV